MKILAFPYGLACANMYVLVFGQKALVVDPCCPWEETGLDDLEVKAVLCTHGHFDHIEASDDIVSRFACPLLISSEDREMLNDPSKNHSMSFGIDVAVSSPSDTFPTSCFSNADFEMSDCEPFSIRIIPTPGHTSGSVCFLFSLSNGEQKIMFTGDMLFKRSIGRTDLGGSDIDMAHSIELLKSLDDDIICYPGHGSKTILGEEKRLNPFF